MVARLVPPQYLILARTCEAGYLRAPNLYHSSCHLTLVFCMEHKVTKSFMRVAGKTANQCKAFLWLPDEYETAVKDHKIHTSKNRL